MSCLGWSTHVNLFGPLTISYKVVSRHFLNHYQFCHELSNRLFVVHLVVYFSFLFDCSGYLSYNIFKEIMVSNAVVLEHVFKQLDSVTTLQICCEVSSEWEALIHKFFKKRNYFEIFVIYIKVG